MWRCSGCTYMWIPCSDGGSLNPQRRSQDWQIFCLLVCFFFVLHEDVAGMWIVDPMFSVVAPQGRDQDWQTSACCWCFFRLFFVLYEDATGMWIPCSGWWLPRGEARIGKTPQGERASCNISNKLPRKISSGLRLDGNNQQILQDIIQIEIKNNNNKIFAK